MTRRLISLTLLSLVTASSAFSQAPDRSALIAANSSLSKAMQKGDLKEAAKLAKAAIVVAESLFGPDGRETAIAYENLGVVLAGGNKHKLAVEPFMTAMLIFEKDLVRNWVDAAKVKGKLATAQWRAGETKEAEATFAEYLSTIHSKFGAESVEVLTAKLAAACFYQASRQTTKAMTELVESFAIAQKNFGRDSRELDQVASACDGSLIRLLTLKEKRLDDGRNRLNELLGYERLRAIKIESADFPIKAPLQGPKQVTIHLLVVKAWVDADGKVVNAKLLTGGKQFESLATSAARESQFKPSMQNGKPIPDVTFIPYFITR